MNVHLHILILDGVYTTEQNGPRFHCVGAPDAQTLERLLNRLVRRIVRWLTRNRLPVEDRERPRLDLEPSDTLDQLNAASIRYRIAVGQVAGGRTLTLNNPAQTDPMSKPFTANRDGFSLNCAVSCHAQQRDRLQRLCRYITRPAPGVFPFRQDDGEILVEPRGWPSYHPVYVNSRDPMSLANERSRHGLLRGSRP